MHGDPEVGHQLRALLERQGHQVRATPALAEAGSLLMAWHTDLLIVECRQLESDGAPLFHLLEQLPQLPLILPVTLPPPMDDGMISLATPERTQEMATQVRSLLARRQEEALQVGDLVIDTAGKRVLLRGQHVLLPPIQFRLLAYLAQNAGRVVGAQELLKAVWGYEGDEAEARELVKVHVRQIRRRLGLEAQRADYVQSVRGFGYMVTAPAAGPS